MRINGINHTLDVQIEITNGIMMKKALSVFTAEMAFRVGVIRSPPL